MARKRSSGSNIGSVNVMKRARPRMTTVRPSASCAREYRWPPNRASRSAYSRERMWLWTSTSGVVPSFQGLGSRRRPGLPADVQAQEVEPGVVPQAVEVGLGQPPLLEIDVGPDDRLLLEDRLAHKEPRGVHDAAPPDGQVVLHLPHQRRRDLARRQVPARAHHEGLVLDGVLADGGLDVAAPRAGLRPLGAQVALHRPPAGPDGAVDLLALDRHRGAEEGHVVLVADEPAHPADVHVEDADVARVPHPPVHALRMGRHELAVPPQEAPVPPHEDQRVVERQAPRPVVQLVAADDAIDPRPPGGGRQFLRLVAGYPDRAPLHLCDELGRAPDRQDWKITSLNYS